MSQSGFYVPDRVEDAFARREREEEEDAAFLKKVEEQCYGDSESGGSRREQGRRRSQYSSRTGFSPPRQRSRRRSPGRRYYPRQSTGAGSRTGRRSPKSPQGSRGYQEYEEHSWGPETDRRGQRSQPSGRQRSDGRRSRYQKRSPSPNDADRRYTEWLKGQKEFESRADRDSQAGYCAPLREFSWNAKEPSLSTDGSYYESRWYSQPRARSPDTIGPPGSPGIRPPKPSLYPNPFAAQVPLIPHDHNPTRQPTQQSAQPMSTGSAFTGAGSAQAPYGVPYTFNTGGPGWSTGPGSTRPVVGSRSNGGYTNVPPQRGSSQIPTAYNTLNGQFAAMSGQPQSTAFQPNPFVPTAMQTTLPVRSGPGTTNITRAAQPQMPQRRPIQVRKAMRETSIAKSSDSDEEDTEAEVSDKEDQDEPSFVFQGRPLNLKEQLAVAWSAPSFDKVMTLPARVPLSSHDNHSFKIKYRKEQPISFDTLQSDDLERWKADTYSLASLGRNVYKWGSSKLTPTLHTRWKNNPQVAVQASTSAYEAKIQSIISDSNTTKGSKLAVLRGMHTRT